MALDPVSWIAVAIIVASLAVAFSGRFLASGALVLGNVLVHLLATFGPSYLVTDGARSASISVIRWDLALHGDLLAAFDPLAFLQLLTHMFVHASFLHLLGNVIVLLAFALPFEERVGHRPFLAIYLISGLAAAFAQSATAWGEPIRMLGASGAVFGIIGAFAGAFPNLVLPLPLPLLYIMIFVRMRVIVAAAVFAGMQIVFQYLSGPGDTTAYFAHLGGLVAGLVLGRTYVRSRRASMGEQAKQKLDLAHLTVFARDEATQTVHRRLYESLDEPDVLEAWLERFFRTARCPTCEAPVALHKHEVVCTHGHRFDMRVSKDGPTPPTYTAGP